MYLDKKISINLPESRYSQEVSTYIGKKSIEIKSISGIELQVYILSLDIHVDELFKTSVQGSLPIMLFLTKAAVEISIELNESECLEITTYNRDTEGVHQVFEILKGIRFHNDPIKINPKSIETAMQRCLSALKADEMKMAREREEARKRGAAIPGAYSVYDEDIAFDLPNGYEFYWNDLGDGNKDGRIITDIFIQEDGEKNAEYMIVVDHFMAREPRNDFFEAAVAEDLEDVSNVISCRLSHDPETVLYTSLYDITIFNTVTSFISINVLVSVARNKLLILRWALSPSIATPNNYDCMEKMLKAVRAIRIHGKPIRLENVDTKTLWTNMYPQECGRKVYEYPRGIDLEIKFNGETVSKKTIYEPKSANNVDLITAGGDTNPVIHSKDAEKPINTELERIEFEEEISRMKECSLINIPASLAELQRRNPNIYWSRMEKYIRKTYNMTPAAWFKAEGIIGSRKKTEEPKKQAERTTKKTTPKSAKPSPIPFDTSKPLTIHSKNKTALEQLSEAEKAFSGTVIVEEGIKEIWSSACDSAKMKKLILPSSLRIIQEGAFYGCVNLEEVVIPDGLEEIKKVAFGNTPKLDNIGLPDSIRKIDKEAFVRSENDNHAHICIHISDKAAKNLVSFSKESPYVFYFYINNKPYDNLDTYKIQELDILEAARVQNKLEKEANEANEKKEEERRAAEERERQEQEELKDGKERFRLERLEIEEYEAKFKKEEEERQRQKEAEKADRTQQKQQRRAEILEKIIALEKELKPVKGMFGLLKRNKIQKQIDALKEQLNHL